MSKSLLNLATVANALSQIQKGAIVKDNNGTQGMKVRCYFDSSDIRQSEEKQELHKEFVTLKLAKKYKEALEIKVKMDALPADEAIMTFKLMEEIPMLTGTKDIKIGEKIVHPRMTNVKEFSIRQNVLEADVVSYVPTGEMITNDLNQEVEVIELSLDRAIMDVQGATKNNGKIRPAIAWVTDISFKSMSVVGTIIWRMEKDQERLFGTTGE